jgi:hypothetical protein
MEVIENTATTTETLKAIKVPGRFTPGAVLAMFGADFLVESFCRMWILGKLHPAGADCPGCGKDILLRTFWDGGRVKCDGCGKYFTALTGTFLSGCHLSFREIVLLALLLALEVPDKQIAAVIKMSAENVRLWRLKFNGQKK